MLASWWSAVSWLSLAGESGEAGDGCWRARMRSLEAATARSVKEAVSTAASVDLPNSIFWWWGHPSTACGAQVPQEKVFSWTSVRVRGAAAMDV
jgi:hypothetical protein